MPAIDVKTADSHECPFDNFRPCRGSVCMAWSWLGPPHDFAETDNLVETEEGQRPIGVPPAPEGDNWETDGPQFKKGYHRSTKEKLPAATAQRWKRERKVMTGCCGRAAPDRYHDNY